MKRKRLITWILASALLLSLLAGCGRKAGTPSEKAELPEARWQVDVTFPDWKGWRSGNSSVNNRLSFTMYTGQGILYLTNEGGCGGLSLYVNDRKAAVPLPAEGETLRADISALTRNGMNSLQVSDIGEGKLRVCIPYPTVTEGKPSDVGISDRSLDLIDRIVTEDIAGGFASAQMAVIKDGRLVYEKSWGNVKRYDENGDPAEGVPVTADTMYDLASNTKMYAGNYAVQYLLTRGEISLDDRIVDILGDAFAEDTIKIDYEGRDPVDPETNRAWKRELTVRDLMMHRGGFPPGPHYYNDRYDHATQDFDSDAGNVIYVGTGADAASREATLEAVFRTPLMYEPGTECMYSDVDYMILCWCVEKITGQRLDGFLRETFWEPMGLTRVCYNPLENGFEKDDCAATELKGNTRAGRMHYEGIRGELIQGEVHDAIAYYCMDGVSGHAGLFASATDLAKLASVMLTGGYGEYGFFSANVMDLTTSMQAADMPDYGLGWWVQGGHNWDSYFGSVRSQDAFGHQGFTGTLTMIDPSQDLVVVFLTNKIHCTMRPDDETLSQFDGGYYLTATLGFVSQILEMGMDGEADKDVYRSLVADMIADRARQLEEDGITDPEHPKRRAYDALCRVLDGMK